MNRPFRRNRPLRALIVFIALLGGGAFVLWRISIMPPAWYSPPNVSNKRVIDLADQVEYRLLEEAQKIRDPEEQWTLRIREGQINAWLAVRLPQWIAHERGGSWPAQLGTPQIHLESEGISLAIPTAQGRMARTVVARVKPTMTEGAIRLELNRAAVGRIAVSGEPLAGLVNALNEFAPQAMGSPELRPIIDLLTQRTPIDPVLTTSDKRRLHLLNFALGDGTLDLTVQTLPANAER